MRRPGSAYLHFSGAALLLYQPDACALELDVAAKALGVPSNSACERVIGAMARRLARAWRPTRMG